MCFGTAGSATLSLLVMGLLAAGCAVTQHLILAWGWLLETDQLHTISGPVRHILPGWRGASCCGSLELDLWLLWG